MYGPKNSFGSCGRQNDRATSSENMRLHKDLRVRICYEQRVWITKLIMEADVRMYRAAKIPLGRSK